MRFLRRTGTQNTDVIDSHTADTESTDESHTPKGYTEGKGHATPKRRESEGKRRGPVAPPPRTTREAIQRNRQLRKQNPASKQERKAAMRERRERMMAGEEQYLLPRDRGPVKAYVRDLVDSRRNVLGLFMPLALLVFVTLIIPVPMVQYYATLITTVMLLGMLVEGYLNGRRITRAAREKFPKEDIRGLSLGWYAFVRASQIRKLRMPKPRVQAGESID